MRAGFTNQDFLRWNQGFNGRDCQLLLIITNLVIRSGGISLTTIITNINKISNY